MFGLISKVIRKIGYIFLRGRGYSNYSAEILFDELMEDLLKNKNLGFYKKLWAYKRGFTGYKVSLYGLNESNYKSYLSDFQYSKMFPINGRYGNWIDDKLTLRYILDPFSEYLPKYYFELHKGKIHKLMDCPSCHNSDVAGLISLLEAEKQLAVKLLSGTAGAGFYKISYTNEGYLLNENLIELEKLKTFLLSLNNYIITEYITAHSSIRKIYDVTPNAIRITLIRNEEGSVKAVGSYMRFGTSKTGMVDASRHGGVFCGVDIKNGDLFSPKFHQNKKVIDIIEHPDSGTRIEGSIPYWPEITGKLKEISEYIPQLKYMGFDVVVTETGFKIIEINSHQSIRTFQLYYNLRGNDFCNSFFDGLISN